MLDDVFLKNNVLLFCFEKSLVLLPLLTPSMFRPHPTHFVVIQLVVMSECSRATESSREWDWVPTAATILDLNTS